MLLSHVFPTMDLETTVERAIMNQFMFETLSTLLMDLGGWWSSRIAFYAIAPMDMTNTAATG
jgi:hypothetical protein